MLHLNEWKLDPGEADINKGHWEDHTKTAKTGNVKSISGTFSAILDLKNIWGFQRGAYIEVIFFPYLGFIWQGDIGAYPGKSSKKTTEYPIDDNP